MSYTRVKVYITPLINEGEYGDIIDITGDIDITDFVLANGLGNIKKNFDDGDYEIGAFVFGSVTLTCFNARGRFNTADDYRSMFRYKRDLAKVKVVYAGSDNNETLVFEGIINDEASKIDVEKNLIKLKVLSLDSIFNQVEVSGGAVATGVSFSDAIKQILNTTAIKAVVNYSADNINVGLDLSIDDGEYFTALTVKEALDDLLMVSNSILYIDAGHNIIVTPRTESDNVFYLYGAEPFGRENIIKIQNYNTGLNRSFSSVLVNDWEVKNEAFISEYGYRQKDISVDFIEGEEKCLLVAQNILDEFATPRLECEVTVPMRYVVGIELLDKVIIDYPFRLTPAEGQKILPTTATFKLGKTKPARAYGSLEIKPNIVWKVSSITHTPKSFTTKLKLRQVGKTIGEGYQ